jgi:hypothetical protein
MVTQRESTNIGKTEVCRDEDPVLSLGQGKDKIVVRPGMPGIAHMNCIVALVAQSHGQRARKIFVYEEPGHLLADCANALMGEDISSIGKGGKNVLAGQTVRLGNIVRAHAAGEFPHDHVDRNARSLDDRLAETDFRIDDDARRDAGHNAPPVPERAHLHGAATRGTKISLDRGRQEKAAPCRYRHIFLQAKGLQLTRLALRFVNNRVRRECRWGRQVFGFRNPACCVGGGVGS